MWINASHAHHGNKISNKVRDFTSCAKAARCFTSTPYEPPHGKTNNLHRRKQRRRSASRLGAFVFATRIVQFLFFLKPKFQASSLLLWLYSLICVRPFRKPHCWFSHEAAHIIVIREHQVISLRLHFGLHKSGKHVCEMYTLLNPTCM